MYRRYDFSNPTENETSRLCPHPLNDKIYGSSIPDKDLQKSIENNGVFNPIIINRNKEILSGTRRWLAAKKARFKKVPVITLLSDGATGLLGEQFLIESNRARTKTQGQLAREASELFRIESELAKQRMSDGPKGTVISSDVKGEACSKVANTLNIGEQKVRQGVAIVRAAESGDRRAQQELKKLDSNETTVNAAYKSIQKEEKKKAKSEHQKIAIELQRLFEKGIEVQTSKEGKFNLFFYRIEESEVRRIAKVV